MSLCILKPFKGTGRFFCEACDPLGARLLSEQLVRRQCLQRDIPRCNLTKTEDGKWYCPVCDPNKNRLLDEELPRICTKDGISPSSVMNNWFSGLILGRYKKEIHKPWPEVERILEHYKEGGKWPCMARIEEWASDVLSPYTWKHEWGPKYLVKKLQPVTHLNLIYHVYASKSNDIWKANLDQLRRRWATFNGRKIVAIASDDTTVNPDEVLNLIGPPHSFVHDPSLTILHFRNDPILREVSTFLHLLQEVKSTDPREATFYAHTKGNTTEDSKEGAMYWRNAMYHYLLDYPKKIKKLLTEHPCVGACKWNYTAFTPTVYPTRLKHGTWMYAGTFFWFRHDCVFTDPRWTFIPDDRYGAESWISGLIPSDRAATVYQPWEPDGVIHGGPYNPQNHPDRFSDVPLPSTQE